MKNGTKSKLRDRLIEVRKRNALGNKSLIKEINAKSSAKEVLPITKKYLNKNVVADVSFKDKTSLEDYSNKEMPKVNNKDKDIKIIFINKNKDKDITSLKELTLSNKSSTLVNNPVKKNKALNKDKVINVKALPKVLKDDIKNINNKSVSNLILKNKEVKKIVLEKKELKQKEELEGRILKRLSKKFKDNLNELEIISSQLFFLELHDNENALELEEQIKKIKEIIKQIDKMKKEYLKLKENYDFDDIIEFDDKLIVDDILEYRHLIENNKNDVVSMMKQYRKIEDYKLLYDHLKYAEKQSKNIKNKLSKEKEEINLKNIYYKDIKVKAKEINSISKSSKHYLDVQENYLTTIMKNVKNITSKKRTEYFFKGFDKYLASGISYLSLMMMRPFRGNTLSMALNIAAARKMVSDARSSIKLESMTKLVYEAYDYKNELRRNLIDLEYLNNNIEYTLGNISKLRDEFEKMFIYYLKDEKYKKVMKELDKVEKVVLANQLYLNKIIKKNKEATRLNDEKLVKVRRLNSGKEVRSI